MLLFQIDIETTFCRGISAGISPSTSMEDIARICIDCKADIILVENESLLKKVIYEVFVGIISALILQVLLIQHKLPELKVIIQFSGEPPISDKRRLHRSHQKQILSWEGVLEIGQVSVRKNIDNNEL